MIDAFMQNPEVPADLRQRWLDAAAQREKQGEGEHARPAYLGTLMAPDREPTSAPPRGPVRPSALEPLVVDTGRLAAPIRETPPVMPATPTVVREDVSQEPPAARWITPSRAELPPEPGPAAAAPRPPVAEPPAPYQAPLAPYQAEARVEPAMVPALGSSWTDRPATGRDSGTAMQAAATRFAGPDDEDMPAEPTAATVTATILDDDQPAMIPLAERQQQLARLEYVCQWLREGRQPLCPVNGALVLLPLGAIEAGPREVAELQRAVKADLTAAQNELKLRFPATALVIGLEEDRGFEELVRRAGPERARSQRFGHRFDVRAEATPPQLAALCANQRGL